MTRRVNCPGRVLRAAKAMYTHLPGPTGVGAWRCIACGAIRPWRLLAQHIDEAHGVAVRPMLVRSNGRPVYRNGLVVPVEVPA